MKEIKINDYLFVYQFEPNNDTPLGRNIYLIKGIDDCILIDTGFPKDILQIKHILAKYQLQYVILTHSHIDHCYGLLNLPKAKVIGSIYYRDSLPVLSVTKLKQFEPKIKISKETNMKFHNHRINLKPLKGHSKSDIFITLDNKYVFIGDNLIMTNQGKQSIPYISCTLNDHFKSLNYIKSFSNKKALLPSHGTLLSKNIDCFINNAIMYLKFLEKKESSIELFYKEGNCEFANDKWHKYNL